MVPSLWIDVMSDKIVTILGEMYVVPLITQQIDNDKGCLYFV